MVCNTQETYRHRIFKKEDSAIIALSESKPQTLPSARERRDEVDLSMAENRLIQEEILQLASSAIENSLRFKNSFGPYAPVQYDHIAVTAGAAAGLDGIHYNICSPGDRVLVPCPYWSGYDAL
ncbi:PLP-dependent transferase [Penicillium sp. IBT 16267x]|nr:PLP-dependent transferase [Penicillium sp. IBT 16267x]